MKVVCVYDPSMLLLKREEQLDYNQIFDIIEAFQDHEQARKLFGFKIAWCDILYEAMQTDPQIGNYVTWGILEGITQILLTYPDSTSPDYIVVNTDGIEPFIPIERPIFNETSRLDGEIVDAWQLLLGASLALEDEPRVCLATGPSKYGFSHEISHRDLRGRSIYPVCNAYEWNEQYRLARNGIGRLLPNEFTPSTPDEMVMFRFCPYNPELREEIENLATVELDEAMVRTKKWQDVRGNRRGYLDCWGNVWMWNGDAAQYHWDVQITDRFKNLIAAKDNHINVSPPTEQYRHEGNLSQGVITHGLGKLHREELRRLTCPHDNCPRRSKVKFDPDEKRE